MHIKLWISQTVPQDYYEKDLRVGYYYRCGKIYATTVDMRPTRAHPTEFDHANFRPI